MPIYEYQGLQYDIDTDDQSLAKTKILGYLEQQPDSLGRFKAAPQQQPVQEGAKMVGEEAPDFTRGVGNILPQLQNVYGGAKVLAGKALGDEEMMQSGIGHMKAGESKTEVKESDDLFKAWDKGIGTVITDWLPYQAGAGVGSVIETLGMMGIGAATGAATGAGVGAIPGALTGALGKTLIKQGVKEAAEKVLKAEGKEAAEKFIEAQAKKTLVSMGSTAGIAAQAGLHGAGETTGRAVEEGQKLAEAAGVAYDPNNLDLTRVLPAAAIHSVADFVSEKIGVNALKGLGSKATNSMLLDVIKAVGVTGTKESIPETIQTVAERYGANLSLTDAEAIKEYVNTVASSYAMSLVPAGIGGVRTNLAGRVQEAPTDTTKTDTTTGAGTRLLDAEGKPIVADETAPDQTTTKESIYAVPLKAAQDKLDALDAGEIKSIHPSTLNKLMRDVGLERPAGIKNDEAIALLREHVAKQGEENALQQTDTGTSGTSTEVPGGSATTTTAAGTTTPRLGRLGVVSDQGTQLAPQNGTGVQQSALDEQTKAAFEKDQAEAAAVETQRQAALQEVAGKKIPQTKTDEEIRDEYELARQAHTEIQTVLNNQISALNEQRKALVEEENKPGNEELDNGEKIAAIDNQLDSLEGQRANTIPDWTKLNQAEKDTFLGSLKTNPSAQDYDNAIQSLAAFREQKKGAALPPAQQRVVSGYEENRPVYQRSLGIDMPAWGNLSPEAQAAYTNNVKNNTAVEQDAGFEAVATQLEQEGKGVRGVSREGVRNLQLKGTEEVSKAAAAERIAKEAAEEASAQGKGETLSKDTKAKLVAGDINGVLSDLIASSKGFKGLNLERGDKTYRQAYAYLANIRKKASALTFRLLATSLNKLTFNSKVVTNPDDKVIQRLQQEGKLAEYNPKTDTFYFTPEGFDESTVLHEIVHAGTVKIISQYLKDPSKLTSEQREAAEHLQKIYDHSKKRLGGKFKNAYENLYEFVGYAMTDNKLQIALAEMQVRPLAKYTAVAMNAWKQFTQALSKMFGLYDAKAQTEELTAEMYAQVAKEYGSMDPNELYEVIKDAETVGEFATSMLNEEGEEKEVSVKKEKLHAKQARRFLTTYPGYEGNLMLEMSEVFSRILAAPKKGIKVEPLAKKAEPVDNGSIMPSQGKGSITKEQQPKNIKYFKDLLFTRQGWRRIAHAIQNDRYEVKHWQDVMDMAGKIYYEGKDKMTNVYGQLSRAPAQGMNLYREFIEETYQKLDKAISDLSKATGFDIKDTLELIHNIAVGRHDYERRLVKYLKIVPLSDTKNLTFAGKTISAAEFRDMAFKKLNDNKTTETEAKQLRADLDSIVFTKNAKGDLQPNMKYVDELGSSPRQSTDKNGKVNGVATGLDNAIYDVSLLTFKEAQQRMAEYEAFPHKALVDQALAQMKDLHETTTELNKMANYWSQPVSNHVAFYGWDNYVPLTGYHSEEDEMLNYDSKRMGSELQDKAYSFEGRTTESNNVVLQSMTDAVRSAMRAGRKDLTQSIKNAAAHDKKLNPNGTGILPTAKVILHLDFADRTSDDVLNKLPKENTVFHYNEDGSIDVIEITDKKLRESIRRTFKETSPLVGMANNITSRLGMMHTRYNFNFAPLNFVRDALTNAWAIGAELGPMQSAKYIADIATRVTTQNSLGKALKVATLYESKNYSQIKALAEKDPIIKDMYEFVEKGGMVDYLQGLSLKSNFQRLHKELGRNGIIRNISQLNRFVDIWTDMFELSSRSAAYAIAKKNFMGRGLNEEAASTKAVEYAKNLANFEQVGQYGKELGSVFMFFRPSATGAVRAIEAVAPAFQSVESAMKDLPPNTSAEAKAAFKASFAERQKNARYMITALMGLGALAYTMSSMMAGDDDLGRNKVANDDPAQWTRFARFFTPFSKNPIQLPWGFGLGSFAASGAQLAMVAAGHQSIGGALGNVMTQISLDSFVPIPVSRMNIGDNPALWMLDSLTPSMFRPAMEFVVNKNGLGQSIYNDANRRMGDAYLGGDNIPEIYKNISRGLFDASLGAIDWSPNSIYFLSNSYMDGPARVVESAVNGMYLASGQAEEKDMIARAKGTPLVGSFIGAVSNVDSRQFSSVENQIKEKEKIYTQAKLKPEVEAGYLLKHPLDPELIDYYNKEVQGRLKELRHQANEIRLMQGLSPRDRASILKVIKQEEDIVKYDLIQQFKAYGVKP